MNELRLEIESSDPSSRSNARVLRSEILEGLSNYDRVTIDLSKVKSMSDSYADELFAILSLQLGLDVFLEKVRIQNSDRSVARVIASNIRVRNLSVAAA